MGSYFSILRGIVANQPVDNGSFFSDFPDYNELNWNPSPDQISHYYVYRRDANEASYSLIDSTDQSVTTYRDFDEIAEETNYLVRAAKLEVTPSGSFYNLSAGSVGTFISSTINYPVKKIEVYPNPARKRITIKADETIRRVELINSYGQVVIQHSQQNDLITLDVSKLVAGNYLVHVTLSN